MIYLASETLSQNKGREGEKDEGRKNFPICHVGRQPHKAFAAVLEDGQADPSFCWD